MAGPLPKRRPRSSIQASFHGLVPQFGFCVRWLSILAITARTRKLSFVCKANWDLCFKSPVSSFPSFPMIWFLYKKVVRSIDPPTDRILPSFLPSFDPLKALELIKLMQKYSLVVVCVVVECPFEKKREASDGGTDHDGR